MGNTRQHRSKKRRCSVRARPKTAAVTTPVMEGRWRPLRRPTEATASSMTGGS
uniref:Uncharacterized protein n=1 Tax=Arundo donax TaxID=35708 RepID=A0A0A9C568_ARUDO